MMSVFLPGAEDNQPSFLLGSRRSLPGVIVTTGIVIDEVGNGLPGAELAPRASAQRHAWQSTCRTIAFVLRRPCGGRARWREAVGKYAKSVSLPGLTFARARQSPGWPVGVRRDWRSSGCGALGDCGLR
jgi:hypothetical protein